MSNSMSNKLSPEVWITGSARSAGPQGMLRLKAGSGRSEERGHFAPSLVQELRTQIVSVTVPGSRNFPETQ